MAEILTLISDAIWKFPGAISPIFMGTGWRPIAFQTYAIIVPSFASVYSIISARESSVVILSHARMRVATVTIGLFCLACHQLLIHLAPVKSTYILRSVFVVFACVAIIWVPYVVGNLITQVINRFGNGPYVIDVDEKSGNGDDGGGDDFWKPGPNFVRRVVARYYLNGLFLPFILLFLFAGTLPLQLLVLLAWLILNVGFLAALVVRDPRFLSVFVGYVALMYFASSYYSIMK